MPRFIDTHAHLDFDQFDEDRKDVLDRCEHCIDAVINPGTDVETSRAAHRLADEHPGLVAAAAGVHPTSVPRLSAEEVDDVAAFVESHMDELVAVGEIGMDFHHAQKEEKRDRQETVFRRFLGLAEDVGKPVIVHSRDAEKQCVSVLEEYDVSGVLHSFNGIPRFAEAGIENGFTIGVSTQVLYSSAVRTLVRDVSLEHLVLETDSPFLYRGNRNHPWHVKQSAQEISDIKNVAVDDVAEKTNQNAVDTFPGLEPVVNA